MKKILVTGGAGYIGSQTCKALKQKGFEPVVYDNLSRGYASNVKWGPLVQADILDTENVTRALIDHKIDAVIHFAAFAYVGESVEKPLLYYDNNCGGTLSLLKAMRKAEVNKIVFSSTCATYGTPTTSRISEDHPQVPINPYGQSKLVVEKILIDECRTWNLEVCALRYFNAAGADSEGELGESHDPETHLIPLVIMAGLGQLKEISVFGEDYETPDGTCIRDYIHVQDLASAHILALEKLKPGFKAYNLGTGTGYSVRQVIDKVSEVVGKKVPQKIVARRPGDPGVLIANPEKSFQELEWRPQFSDLDTIIRSATAWASRPRS